MVCRTQLARMITGSNGNGATERTRRRACVVSAAQQLASPGHEKRLPEMAEEAVERWRDRSLYLPNFGTTRLASCRSMRPFHRIGGLAALILGRANAESLTFGVVALVRAFGRYQVPGQSLLQRSLRRSAITNQP